MYALGWTQHSKGSQNIRAMAMLQLMLGNIGVRGGGMNALRGHSNIQGLTDIGLMSNLHPRLSDAADGQGGDVRRLHVGHAASSRCGPDQMSYWQNYKKFFVSFQKAMWGAAATADNNLAYDWLPKLDVPLYDISAAFELMHQGQDERLLLPGLQSAAGLPEPRQDVAALCRKLKFLVVMDPLDTETARFWENHGEYNDVDPAKIQTEVIQLPTTCFAEDDGSLDQFRPLAAMALGGRRRRPARPSPTSGSWRSSIQRLRDLYRKEGGAFPSRSSI